MRWWIKNVEIGRQRSHSPSLGAEWGGGCRRRGYRDVAVATLLGRIPLHVCPPPAPPRMRMTDKATAAIPRGAIGPSRIASTRSSRTCNNLGASAPVGRHVAGAAAGLDAAYRALIYAGEFDAAYCVASDAMASGQMPAPMRGQINDALYALEAAGGVAGITLPVDLDWIRYVASIADHGYASTLPTRQRIHCYPERWQAITALARGHWAEGMTDAGSNEPKREPPIEIKQWGALWYAQRGRERTMNFLFRQELEQALHTGKAWERACALPLQPTPQHPCLPTEPDALHPLIGKASRTLPHL